MGHAGMGRVMQGGVGHTGVGLDMQGWGGFMQGWGGSCWPGDGVGHVGVGMGWGHGGVGWVMQGWGQLGHTEVGWGGCDKVSNPAKQNQIFRVLNFLNLDKCQ